MSKPITDEDLERFSNQLAFVMNRIDGVALDVVGWMPEEDNAKHHNAVEMLSRAFQVLEAMQTRVAEAQGEREVRRLHHLVRWYGTKGMPEWFKLGKANDKPE